MGELRRLHKDGAMGGVARNQPYAAVKRQAAIAICLNVDGASLELAIGRLPLYLGREAPAFSSCGVPDFS